MLEKVIEIKILNFGSCNIDYVYSLPYIIRKGETLNSDKMDVFAGGKGLNQSIALARAGAVVFHAGCIGNNGEMLAQLLLENGVDITNIKRVNCANGHAIIQVSRDGENSIFLYAGSNSMITTEQIENTLESFGADDIILLQNEINCLDEIVERAYEKGMCIILNPSPINEKIADIDFNKITYLILNEVEAGDISGCDETNGILDFFRERYPELKVMLTLGKKGCVYADAESRIYHPIFETEVCDTTAAGDTFTGYFVAGISNGHSIEDTLRTASCASALAVSCHGAAPSIPNAQEVSRALETMKIKGE